MLHTDEKECATLYNFAKDLTATSVLWLPHANFYSLLLIFDSDREYNILKYKNY